MVLLSCSHPSSSSLGDCFLSPDLCLDFELFDFDLPFGLPPFERFFFPLLAESRRLVPVVVVVEIAVEPDVVEPEDVVVASVVLVVVEVVSRHLLDLPFLDLPLFELRPSLLCHSEEGASLLDQDLFPDDLCPLLLLIDFDDLLSLLFPCHQVGLDEDEGALDSVGADVGGVHLHDLPELLLDLLPLFPQ